MTNKKLLNIPVLFFFLQVTACGLCPMALRAQDVTAPATSYSEVPQEIVIKSEAGDELLTRKPPVKVNIDQFDSISKSLEADKSLFLFNAGDFVGFSRNYPEKLFSERVIRHWITSFRDHTVINFYPRSKFDEAYSGAYNEKNSKRLQWTLSITDEDGNIFHKYSGTGLPPEILTWSGENNQHEWVRAGHTYAPVYVFVDEAGSPKTLMGELVKFTVIGYQKGSSFTIGMDSAALFGPNKKGRVLDKEKGEPLLASIADLIKRRYYNMPLRINVYAQTVDLAGQQADLIKNYLKAELMCSENLFSCEGYADTYAQQRADIVLLNK